MQVSDDIEVLDKMLADHRASEDIYQWTNYWARKCGYAVDYLKTNGLTDFRRIRAQKDTPAAAFASFGAVDLLPSDAMPDDLMAAVAKHSAGSPVRDIYSLPASRVGNPEGFEHNGTFLTLSWINFYLRYAYVRRFMDLSSKVIVEIGSGSAKQAHLLKLAHSDATILIFDIPPQLYVANQYLKAVLNQNELVDFQATRAIRSYDDIEPGKVHVFGNWEVGLLRDIEFDLLWNAASFQEMEPHVVRHYLAAVQGAKSVYLMQAMRGQRVAKAPGKHGVLKATTKSTYRSALPSHTLVSESVAHLAVRPRKWPYTETFWTKTGTAPPLSLWRRLFKRSAN